MNNLYQNTTNRMQAPKEKKWTISLLLEKAKSKNFQSPDLEIEFLIDSGAKSNIYNLPIWKKIQTLRISSSKSSSKLASAQVKPYKLWKNSIISCLKPNNGTKQTVFTQLFHKTDVKHSIVEISFVTK